VRLRPIVMTSLAFIVGCVPLCFAEGAGSAARQILGTAVVAGMLLATVIAVMFIPMLYVTVERLFGRRSPAPSPAAPTTPEVAS
jgi:multidrug efflux pump